MEDILWIISLSCHYLDQRFSNGVLRHTGVTRRVCRWAVGICGKVERKREKKLRSKIIVEVNFGIAVYFS
jgi:hypothetical protein